MRVIKKLKNKVKSYIFEPIEYEPKQGYIPTRRAYTRYVATPRIRRSAIRITPKSPRLGR